MEANETHMLLMRELSKVISDFQKENPTVDGCEIMAVLGAVAGACISSAPDMMEMSRARQSLINSMDQAIVDFGIERASQK